MRVDEGGNEGGRGGIGPDGEERMRPGAPPLRDTVALDGDGSCIAEARRRAVGFLARVQADTAPSTAPDPA